MRSFLEPLPPRRILVVDNDRGSAKELATQFAKAGHTVEVANDFASGVTRGAHFKPEIAIINLGLPGTDATALARFLWMHFKGAVTLVTDGGTDEDLATAAQCDCFSGHVVRFHGMPLLSSGGVTVKLADRSPEDWLQDVLKSYPREALACQMLEAASRRFDPAELVPLISDELLCEVRTYAERPSDPRNYLATFNAKFTNFDEYWEDALKGASRWLRFFNP